MTETTANFESHKGNWLLFLSSLIAAPFLASLTGLILACVFFPFFAELSAAGMLLLFAPFMGLKTYVLFGAPLFAAHIRLLGCNPWALAITGLAAHHLSVPFLQYDASPHTIDFVISVGYWVAPVWGYFFGLLYRWGEND